MEALEQLVKLLVASGPYGIATAAILWMGWIYHKNILTTERSRLEETKADKIQAQTIIVGNTEAMTRLCSAVDNMHAILDRLLLDKEAQYASRR